MELIRRREDFILKPNCLLKVNFWREIVEKKLPCKGCCQLETTVATWLSNISNN